MIMPKIAKRAEKVTHWGIALCVGILALSACAPMQSPDEIKQDACIETLDRVAVWAELTAEQREDLLKEIDCTPPGWEHAL